MERRSAPIKAAQKPETKKPETTWEVIHNIKAFTTKVKRPSVRKFMPRIVQKNIPAFNKSFVHFIKFLKPLQNAILSTWWKLQVYEPHLVNISSWHKVCEKKLSGNFLKLKRESES